jgi:hypothetical protein
MLEAGRKNILGNSSCCHSSLARKGPIFWYVLRPRSLQIPSHYPGPSLAYVLGFLVTSSFQPQSHRLPSRALSLVCSAMLRRGKRNHPPSLRTVTSNSRAHPSQSYVLRFLHSHSGCMLLSSLMSFLSPL